MEYSVAKHSQIIDEDYSREIFELGIPVQIDEIGYCYYVTVTTTESGMSVYYSDRLGYPFVLLQVLSTHCSIQKALKLSGFVIS